MFEFAGAPGTIRTSDPQIRSLGQRTITVRVFCKPAPFSQQEYQRVKHPFANHMLVVQRDDGKFAIGWHDDFESRWFAEEVAVVSPTARMRRATGASV
jgi:hypothetical protein